MRQFTPPHRLLSLVLLILFTFSMQGAMYGHHAADEKSHLLTAHTGAGEPAFSAIADHGSHQHQQDRQDQRAPFDDSDKSEDGDLHEGHGHCHATALPAGAKIAYTPFHKDLAGTEIVFFLPEVYLKRFIPPQNLA